MSGENNSATCINCRSTLVGHICHECGQKRLEQRWSTPDLMRQFFQQLTDVERGFLFTVKELLVHPGDLVRDYWNGKTIPFYNPFRYVLIWTAINLIINFWLGIDDIISEQMQPPSLETEFGADHLEAADQHFDNWLNALVLVQLPVFALLTKWLFSKGKNNYAENLILISFLMGEQAVISSFVQFVFYFIPVLFPIFIPFTFLWGWAYNTYVFKRVFGEKTWITALKALLIGLIGIVVFWGLVTLAQEVALALSQ